MRTTDLKAVKDVGFLRVKSEYTRQLAVLYSVNYSVCAVNNIVHVQ